MTGGTPQNRPHWDSLGWDRWDPGQGQGWGAQTRPCTLAEELPRPTLEALPGTPLSLRCAGSLGGMNFALYRVGVQDPLLYGRSPWRWADFPLPSPGAPGTYVCYYHTPSAPYVLSPRSRPFVVDGDGEGGLLLQTPSPSLPPPSDPPKSPASSLRLPKASCLLPQTQRSRFWTLLLDPQVQLPSLLPLTPISAPTSSLRHKGLDPSFLSQIQRFPSPSSLRPKTADPQPPPSDLGCRPHPTTTTLCKNAGPRRALTPPSSSLQDPWTTRKGTWPAWCWPGWWCWAWACWVPASGAAGVAPDGINRGSSLSPSPRPGQGTPQDWTWKMQYESALLDGRTGQQHSQGLSLRGCHLGTPAEVNLVGWTLRHPGVQQAPWCYWGGGGHP